MAVIGKWTGGTVGVFPGTSWANASLFATEDRNDGSAYSQTGGTITLPSSDLADGYLLIGAYEFEDTSNGRCNPQGQFVQASGTGNFIGGPTGGYNRDNSEDRSYVRAWAFVDNPSASSTYSFQWKRDTDSPTGGTVRSELLVIPLFYSDVGIYASTDHTLMGGTTPNVVPGWTTTLEGTNITRSGNVITAAGDNKRYLVLGSQFFEGRGGRTQRWHGLDLDGAQEDAAKAYSYYRSTSNDESGDLFTWLFETVTANVTIEQTCYRGDGVSSGQGGADVDGSDPGVGDHALVVVELNDSAEVFRSTGSTNQNVATTGPVDVQATKVADVDFNDSASFTRASDTAMNAEKADDMLLGANLSAASQAITTGQRWTGYGEFTLNGTEDADTFAGDYCRNNQTSQDTFGWSANLLDLMEPSVDDDLGVSVTELSGSEGGGGAIHLQAGWVGFWGINLDTLEDTGSTVSLAAVVNAVSTVTAALTVTGETHSIAAVSAGVASFTSGFSPFHASASVVTADLTVTGGTTVGLAAVVNAAASTTAVLSVTREIAAAPAAVSSTTATLSVTKRLECSPASVSTVTASSRSTLGLVAAPAAVSTVTALASCKRNIAAIVSGSSTVTASLSSTVALEATVTASSTVTAVLSVARPLEAVVNGSSSTTAAVTLDIALAADVAGSSTVTVALTVQKIDALQAEVDAVSATTAALRRDAALAAAADGVSAVTAAATVTVALEATVAAVSTVTAELERAAALQAVVAAAATVTPALRVDWALVANPSPVSSVTAEIGCARPLAALSTGVSSTVCALSATRSLSAAPSAVSSATAGASLTRALATLSEAVSTCSADLTIAGAVTLEAVVNAAATVTAEVTLDLALAALVDAVASSTVSASVTRRTQALVAGSSQVTADVLIGLGLEAVSAAASTTTTAARVDWALAAQADAVAAVDALLSTSGEVPLRATVTALTTTTVDMSLEVRLLATVAAEAAAAGDVTVTGAAVVALAALIAAESAATGDLTLTRALVAQADAVSSLVALAAATRGLHAQSSPASVVAVELELGLGLETLVAAVATVQGDLVTGSLVGLAALSDAVSAVTATMLVGVFQTRRARSGPGGSTTSSPGHARVRSVPAGVTTGTADNDIARSSPGGVAASSPED